MKIKLVEMKCILRSGEWWAESVFSIKCVDSVSNSLHVDHKDRHPHKK